jgi:hypothetical protein
MIGRVSEETISELKDVLEDGEQVVGGLASLSAALVLTDRRLVIIREGWRHRPRSGIRAWPLDGSFGVRAVPRGSAGAVIIEQEPEATSYFVAERDWRDAQRLVSEARRLSSRADR